MAIFKTVLLLLPPVLIATLMGAFDFPMFGF